MASRFENQRYGRGRDPKTMKAGAAAADSNYGREDDYSGRGRQRFGQGGTSSYGREFGEGYGRGSYQENQRNLARRAAITGVKTTATTKAGTDMQAAADTAVTVLTIFPAAECTAAESAVIRAEVTRATRAAE